MPPPCVEPAGPTRRSLLLGGVQLGAVAAVAAACTSTGAPADPAGSGAATASSSPTVAAVDADAQLVAEVLRAVAGVRALVVAVRRRRPALADPLAALVRAHAAHGRALGDLPAATGTPAPARGEAAALAQVVAAEQRLQAQLTEAVVAARSGSLAASLASVTASVAQHLAVLAGRAEPARLAGDAG